MYTLDQQIKDVDKAIGILNNSKKGGYPLYLCIIANEISFDFYSFLRGSLLRIEKISPKSYSKAIIEIYKIKIFSYYPVWSPFDYESRLQFLNDLKEYIIENG